MTHPKQWNSKEFTRSFTRRAKIRRYLANALQKALGRPLTRYNNKDIGEHQYTSKTSLGSIQGSNREHNTETQKPDLGTAYDIDQWHNKLKDAGTNIKFACIGGAKDSAYSHTTETDGYIGYSWEEEFKQRRIEYADSKDKSLPISQTNPYATKAAMRQHALDSSAIHLEEKKGKWKTRVWADDKWDSALERTMKVHKDALDKLK